MAQAPMLPFLLILAATRCRSASVNGYHNGNGATQFGELLKPPPPPPLSPIAPVPFHGGSGRLQRQNLDTGYHYQPPPPPPPPPLPPSAEFKFPAPFYKQYNFNFVPPPQPFSTTPSPTLFQKVSGWLFSSQQTNYDAGSNNVAPAPIKKDCNPCNLVPWIPVIRYNVGAKNIFSSSNPTYGPPSPTGYLEPQKVVEYKPQPFQTPHQNLPQLSTGIPHAEYGLPVISHPNSFNGPSSTYGPPISTYGPPSPTHTVAVSSPNALSSTYSQPSNSYGAPSSSYSAPSSSYGVPSSSYGAPSSSYNAPSHSSSTSINYPTSSFSSHSSTHGGSSTSFSISSSSFATPSPSYGFSESTTYSSVTPLYEPELLNSQLPQQNDIGVSNQPELSGDFQLPKVTPPTTFRNSYGEPIPNNYISDIPYPVSATAAESMKIKTEVLPNSTPLSSQNASLALANPAPFTLNRGRNIHTLQPVALPNLSVSPLPPIFNARPFRPTSPKFPTILVQGINSMQQNSNNVKIEQSVPLAEFTHSVDYPASFVQSPVIDVDVPPKTRNETKAYRNIPNAFILNELRDISSQATEDHAAKTLQDSSFESTGTDVGNELYDSGIPMGFKLRNVPSANKNNFADLRGIKDEYVDKYRTEGNLQNIDSPLLYLKPSAPHKEHGNFVLAISTPINDHDYEIYDESPTTATPQISTPQSAWDEGRNDYNEPPPTAAQESIDRPKIVQIIVPYTSGRNQEDWEYTQDEYYRARKMPSNTENSILSTVTENYNTPSTTTEESTQSVPDNYDAERIKTAEILNDLYDVKEPPFDIIKLQHTIDDWTEQEYSEHYKTPQRTRGFEKYAKQIPDEYFTTTMPTNYVTSNDYNYDFNDHEGSSSIQHSVTEDQNYIPNSHKPRKEYNVIARNRTTHSNRQEEKAREIEKLHIYTAASTFRSTTTTPAPWGKILTSISPLTKEKVYVVTSKPWRDSRNVTNDWYAVESFESKKTNNDNVVSASDNLPFKSPRFVNRPSLGFSSEESNSMKSDSSYGFSKSWYQSINDLENRGASSNMTWPEGSPHKHTTNLDEVLTDTTTADLHSNSET
ncbi:signaling mucin HKR1-like isoform X1 [Ostrinia furnacalis]|uniref:signaling mucin HKR1-like isoform X1 n=1 Tax=Ostrinia furnacalis TaxID=93504 RepID=UPI0010394BB3|nr:signaling mucin HKR1-like isoform X1 [Ostrinia furnacalis]